VILSESKNFSALPYAARNGRRWSIRPGVTSTQPSRSKSDQLPKRHVAASAR